MDLKVQPLQNQGQISSVGTLGSQASLTTSPQNSQSDNGQLDPQAVAMAQAIRKTESNGNFKAKGKSGEYGAYQFTGGTWNSAAQKYLGYQVPVNEATPEQQNEVAYKRIKEWKDQGYNPGQIASMWNAGSGEPDAYQGTFSNGNPAVGVNKYGVHYSVPDYALKVANNYQQLKKQDTFNPTPFSNPNPGEFDFTGQSENTSQTSQNQDQGLAKNLLEYDTGFAKSIGQLLPGFLTLGGKIGNFVQGKGFQQEIDPNSPVGKMNSYLAPTNKLQQAGNLVGDVAQFFVPGVGEDKAALYASKGADALNLGTKASKALSLAAKGTDLAVENSVLSQAQGNSNNQTAVVGGLSFASPFAGELLEKIIPAVKDFFGGEGTTDALKVKNSTPKLVEAWQTGNRTVSDLADTITQTAKNYETQGKKAFNAIIDNLPDIKMPQNFIEGGLRQAAQDIIDNSSANLNDQEAKTVANLQKYIENGDVQGVKGIQNLRQGIDNAGFYRTGANADQYQNSNGIITKVRNMLNEASQYQASLYDQIHGTQTADKLKNALAQASDRIKFMDKFKANLIGTNPETYVERTVNKVKTLINKFGNPADYENTKDLLKEFEARIGQPGLFEKDFQAANAAKTLKGLTGRVATKLGLGFGAEELLSGGGLTKLGKKGLDIITGNNHQ